ncbi:MAG: RsmF rRNA methyltransferase first C-terminal domain-containing protein [Lachnospiraceae bacterium]|nr:RsmF rRNA methyltransferase first C-terminal domain-containing protein [Lachnospiraceae bacterium]
MMLPKKYRETMRGLLGEEYSAYEASFSEEARTALRINTAKISPEQWQEICPFETEPVPWTKKGFLLKNPAESPAKHPYYYAGLYYIQEPSAMIPAAILPVQKGERVLDLCAAPGGKATELAAKLQGEGVLVANDISVSRGMALAKNLQIAGAKNAVVTAEAPEKLVEHFPEYFDKILIDAPCSGEGMFRRDSHMIQDWEERGPAYYVDIQKQILASAYEMLRQGGSLVYSTCTFSPMEDEEMVLWFIRQYPDMHVCMVEEKPGFSSGNPDWVAQETSDKEREELRRCIRIFPHRAAGEGHFAVLLQKGEDSGEKACDNGVQKFSGSQVDNIETSQSYVQGIPKKKRHGCNSGQDMLVKRRRDCNSALDIPKETKRWTSLFGLSDSNIVVKKDTAILEGEIARYLQGLRCIQTGLIVGNCKKRFEPSVQFALTLSDTTVFPRINLPVDDIRVIRYLKGETIQDVAVEGEERMDLTDGYVLLCVDGFALGWGKYTGNGTVKNKYYAGWRMQ